MTLRRIFLLISFINIGCLSLHSCSLPNNVEQAIDWIDSWEDSKYESALNTLTEYLANHSAIHATCKAMAIYKLGVVKGRLLPHSDSINWVILKHYKQASEWYCEENQSTDDFNLKMVNNIASRFSRFGGFYEIDSFPFYLYKFLALEENRKEKTGNYSTQFPSLCHNLAYHYNSLGDYENAESKFITSALYYEKAGNLIQVARVYNDLIWFYSDLIKDPFEGVKYGLEALKISGIHTDDTVNIYLNLAAAYGNIYGLETDPVKRQLIQGNVLRYSKKAFLKNRDKGSYTYDPYKDLINYSNLGVQYIRLEAYDSAVVSLLQAYNLIQSNQNESSSWFNDYLPIVYDNLGEAYVGLKEYDKALDFFTQAIGIEFWSFNPKDEIEIPFVSFHSAVDLVGGLETLHSKADLLYKTSFTKNTLESQKAYQNSAFCHFKLLDSLVYNIQKGLSSSDAMYYLLNHAEEVYESAIGLCISLSEQVPDRRDFFLEEAWYFMERSKSVALTKFMNERKAAFSFLSHSAKDSLMNFVQKRDYLDRRIQQVKREGDSVEWGKLIEDKSVLLTRYENYRSELAGRYEGFDNETNAHLTVEDLTFVRKQLLDEEQAILEYYVGDSSAFVLQISSNGIQSHRIPYSPLIKQEVLVWLKNLSESFHSQDIQQLEADKLAFSQQAYQLHQELLSGLNIENYNRLIIIPDKYLAFLPFEILLTDETDSSLPYSDFPYLIKEKALSYAYSCDLLRQMRENSLYHQSRSTWGAFSPVFSRKDFPNDSLGSLGYTDKFVSAWMKEIGGALFRENAATRRQFLERAESFKYLILATHGIINEDSSLVQFRFWDHPVFLDQLYALNLNSDMVFLLACQTSVGKLYPGEGVVSLNNGFVRAGASALFTTLMEVKDFFTPTLLGSFSKELEKGKSKDEALRETKLALIKQSESSHPFLWSPYIIYGDVSPIEKPTVYSFFMFIPFILAFILLALIMSIKMKGKF